jgi:hypothetical protein
MAAVLDLAGNRVPEVRSEVRELRAALGLPTRAILLGLQQCGSLQAYGPVTQSQPI